MKALILLSLLGIAVLFAGLFNLKNKSIYLAVLGIAAAVGLNFMDWGTDISYYNDMIRFDNYSLAFSSLLALTTGLVLLLGFQYYKKNNNTAVDLYALMIFTLVGAICLVAFNHLAILFIGIEILSIPLYILAGSNRSDLNSNEAGMKYFLMGAFTSGFLLMGIALVFVSTGSFHLDAIKAIVQAGTSGYPSLLLVGILLIIGSFLFKVAAVPFHFWAPDVYQGSPTIATALMATVVKTAAFASMFKLLNGTFSEMEGTWYNAMWTITAITLLLSNITALSQTSLKRLLAYSSVSHAGYMMLAILTLNTEAGNVIFFYSVAYSLATIVAFALTMEVISTTGTDAIEGLRGLGKRNPFLAFALAIAFLSLAGIPPLAGFMAKFYLFKTAIDVNLIWIVIIAVIGSIISAYYYLRVIATMYLRNSEQESSSEKLSPIYYFVIGLGILGTLWIGLFPDQLMTILK